MRRPIPGQVAEPAVRQPAGPPLEKPLPVDLGPVAVATMPPPAVEISPMPVSVTPATVISAAARVPMQTPTGTIDVDAAIYREWVSLSTQTTVSGGDVQSYLGWPLRMFTTRPGATVVYFERGAIILRPDSRCFAVYGAIYLHYRELIDLENPAGGFDIGLPIGEEQAVTKGRRSRFDAGDIYFETSTGNAFEVHGAIRAHWEQLGGVGGFLGNPISDESPVMRSGVEVGRFNSFEGGTMYWSGASGAFEVHGAIRDRYLHAYGGPAGSLGFPLSDETDSPQGSKRYNTFQNGCLTWDKGSGRISIFRSLDVFVDSISGSGSHTFAESIGAASVWIYAWATVTTNTGFNFREKLPPDRDSYGQPNANPGVLTTVSPIRGDMSITVTLDGYDKNVLSSDTHLGTVSAQFNADNDFGRNQPQQLNDGDFHATFDMRERTPDNPFDPNFRKDFFWGVTNTGTPSLDTGQFAETFVDVGQDESPLHWFNSLFYKLVFRTIAAGGNCFGMSLESIYAEKNSSIFSEPIYNVSWGTAVDEINEKQAYQLGAEYLDWFAANFLTGRFWNPVCVFYDSQAAWFRGDYPVICLTTTNLSSGHCVRPCGPNAYQDNGRQLIITVANPNTPGSDDSNPQNRIVIDKASNTYYFDFNGNGSNPWTGGNFTGGIISWAPFCILGHEPRTPFWEAMAALLGVALIILGAGAQTKQITDDKGRTFYKPGLTGAPTRWDDTLLNGTQIPGMVRLPLTHRANGGSIAAANLAAGKAKVSVGPITLAGESLPELYHLTGLPSPYGPSPVQKTFTPIKAGATMGAAPLASVRLADSNVTASAVRASALLAQPFAGGLAISPTSAPPSTIKHEVVGGTAGYDWAVRTPAGSVIASVAGGKPATDTMILNRFGTAQQEIQIALDAAGPARVASLTLVGPVAPDPTSVRSFQLTQLNLQPGHQLSAGIAADGMSLNITNAGPDVTFELQAQVGFQSPRSVTKTAALASGKAATITPDWTNLPNAPVPMTVRPQMGGAIEKTINL